MCKILKSYHRWRDSVLYALSFLSVGESLWAILGCSFPDYWTWYQILLLLLIIFGGLLVITFWWLGRKTEKEVSLKIHGIEFNIKQGDIFKAKGWKVIPFNEHYDTQVDDIIIAHNTLNGIFIDEYAKLEELQSTITNETDAHTTLKRRTKNGHTYFPLGRIIRYKDEYMLLAFTHFENNRAHLSQSDYEDCLRNMWMELDRTYANKPIFIPLIGSGITRYDDNLVTREPIDFIRCMIHALRYSSAQIKAPITLLLTEDTIKQINMYELKYM